jgi:hypothetical protein
MQSFDEGIVHWGEAIVRCGYEYTAASQFRDEAEKVPSGRVGDYFASEALGCAAGKRSHALSSEAGHEPLYGCVLFVDGKGLQAAGVEVGCGDGHDSLDCGVVRASLECHEAARAVTNENDVAGVGAELFGIGGIADIGDGGLSVFDGVSEGEVAGGALGATVLEVDHVPAIAADGLREVEILFVSGKAVEKDDDRMRACSGGDVGERVELGAVAGNLKGLHCGWVCLVWRRFGCDGRGKLLRVEWEDERHAEKCGRGDKVS